MIHFGTDTPPTDLIEMINELLAYNARREKEGQDKRTHRLELLPEQQAIYTWDDHGYFF